jgi:hypothetical protein
MYFGVPMEDYAPGGSMKLMPVNKLSGFRATSHQSVHSACNAHPVQAIDACLGGASLTRQTMNGLANPGR